MAWRWCSPTSVTSATKLLQVRFRRDTVLVQGSVLVEGTPEEIARDKRVHQVYLGEQSHA